MLVLKQLNITGTNIFHRIGDLYVNITPKVLKALVSTLWRFCKTRFCTLKGFNFIKTKCHIVHHLDHQQHKTMQDKLFVVKGGKFQYQDDGDCLVSFVSYSRLLFSKLKLQPVVRGMCVA